MTAENTFPLVTVSGSAYEMGLQHGQQAAELIQRYLLLTERLTQMPREVLCRNAMRFLLLMEKLSPALLEEVRGLADGAGLSFEEAMLCQARAEAAYRNDEGCTAFAVTGEATLDGHTLAGQNQDLPPEFSDVGILLHLKPNDGRPRTLMFTFAGQLGYSGMNSHGMALFANALYDYHWQLGLPKYAMMRVILEQRSVADALRLLEAHRLCSANNLVLADGQGAIADIEIRPEGIAVFDDSHPHRLAHTNHHITPDFAALETHSLADSCPRLDRMNAIIQEHWGRINVATMQASLADHANDPGGICRHGATGFHSIAGYVADPARGELHVRRGHGCLGTWKTYAV